MLKFRLKKTGRKRYPSFRLVVMENSTRRDGQPIDEIGYYSPISKKLYLNTEKAKKWIKYGAHPTSTVLRLLKKNGILSE